MVEAYVGKNVVLSIGTIKIAQADDGRLEFLRDVQVSQPLGQEEKVFRTGGREVRWQVVGNQVNITSWAFAVGADAIAKVGTNSNSTLKQYNDDKIETIEMMVKRLFTYDAPITWEMTDPISKKTSTFVIRGVIPASIVVQTRGRGFVKQTMRGVGTGMKITRETTSDEDIDELN